MTTRSAPSGSAIPGRARPRPAPRSAAAISTIENTGPQADRLVSVSSGVAGRVEVHEMAVTNGIMTMRPLEAGIVIPPGAKVELKPGGFHVMFMELNRPLKQDERLKGTLTFEKAGPVEVEFKVEAVGAKPAAGDAHKH